MALWVDIAGALDESALYLIVKRYLIVKSGPAASAAGPSNLYLASITSTGIPSLSNCGFTFAASPTTTQVKPLGLTAARID